MAAELLPAAPPSIVAVHRTIVGAFGVSRWLPPAVAPEAFVAVWQALPLAEQARVLQRLVERVDYQAAQQSVSIAFRPDAGTALVEELARSPQETNP